MQKKGLLTPKTVTRITALWMVGYCSMYYAGSFIAGILTDSFSYSGLRNIDENENENLNGNLNVFITFLLVTLIKSETICTKYCILLKYYRFFIIHIIFSVSRDFSWILSHSFTYLYCDETLHQR